jgi:8-oxo-dGTP pyrophosphatase MutT (NUDIX family)
MAGTRVTVPGKLAERARELAAGRLPVPEPVDAATVMLLRSASGTAGASGASGVSGVSGFEAYLMRRTRALEFAPGACVFPGGSVDEQDADPQIGWAGPSPAQVAERLGTTAERARALVCAAVRETFEESGVLLAGSSLATLADDSAVLAPDRHALLEGSTSFAELLGRRGLVLRADLLTPWARWITPEASPRRFDTWFFAAALPPGQTAALAAGESDAGIWLRPAQALESARAGQITLLPPTAVTLGELAGHQTVAGLLAQRQVITPRLPKVMVTEHEAWLVLP